MKIVGIAGGSGSGKSTVSYALVDANPETYEILNLDDYQKRKEDPTAPKINGIINWDHPDIIRWEDLILDIQTLKNGLPVTIQSWAHRSNPDYATHRRMVARTVQPKTVLIVEGYLALYNPNLNQLFDKTFYFDIDEEIRNARRDKTDVIGEDDYETEVLVPMHKKYVEPTKLHADVVVDVSELGVDEVSQLVRESI